MESGTGTVIPQTLVATVANPTTGTNAGLYAVARYHRNPCYRPDLSGEVSMDANGQVANPVGCSSNRTNFQEISVSRPKVASAAELNGATSSALTFDFSNDPIPINATDLIFQVVYRGQLGEESDGIAVGSFDVREPSYVTLWNNSDWGACNNAWVQSFSNGCTPSSGTTLRVITTANLCVGSQILLAHNGNIDGNLTLGRYLRVAVVMDERTLTTRARTIASLTPTITDLLSRTFLGQRRQSDFKKGGGSEV